jgi:hypothetical protein
MYYKLGLGGKALWCGAVFLTWLAVTMVGVSVTIHFGMSIGDGFREWCRSVGFNPILSDMFKLFSAAVGFVMVPIITAAAVAKLNKRLKGKKK